MKCRLNMPIEYDSRRYGYYYSKPVENFPSMPMAEVEVFALLIADKALAQYHGTPWHTPLETAFKRLMGQLDPAASYTMSNLDSAISFRPFAPEETDLTIFERLTRSLQERREVTFQYRNLGAGEWNKRKTHPYHVACVDSHWYLFAFDLDRQAMRTFALSRMNDLTLTQKHFPKPKPFNLDEYLKGSFAVLKGRADHLVVVEFDVWATDLLRGRRWHSSQEFEVFSDGHSRLKMRLNSIKEVERFVLSFGTHARVVQPAELVARMKEVARALTQRYK
jgi:proteasome accessory factor B